MDEKGFREFVKEGKRVPKGLSERTIKSHVRLVKEFEEFLSSRRPKKHFNDAGDRDIKAFVRHLAKDERNIFDNLIGLLRYARFSGNEDAVLSLLTILDSGNVLEAMCGSIRSTYGKRKYDELLGGFEPPSIGTSPKLMPRATSQFMRRLESGIGEEGTRRFLQANCPHTGPPKYYAEEKKMLGKSKSVDKYLRRRRQAFMNELTGHMKNGTLFYNQKIDQEVIDFVRGNPEIAGGIRRGNRICCTKIPYMAIEYLREKDPTKKRYYYCHCPLARESIPAGKAMSRNLCYCSSGYEKRPFEIAFGVPLNVEVKKSVLWGDSVCRFSIEIPKKHLPKKGR